VASARAYKAFFDKALQAHLAYGGSLLMSLAAQSSAFGVTLMVWAYALNEQASLRELFAYLTLAFVLNYSFNLFLERTVGERIREGLVATDLLKPVDFQLFYAVQSLSDMVFQIIIALIVFGLAFLRLGPALLPASAASLGFFLLSLGLGFCVQYGLCFCFVQAIFATNSNYGAFATRAALHQTFSGVFAPLSLFPPLLKSIALWLPFHHIIHTPAAIYLGWISGPQLLPALLGQAAWALGLVLAGRLLFKSILGRLAIQGG
jgi:ABC-2 type transport system permease protein